MFGFTDPVFYRLAGTSAFRDMLPSTSATPAELPRRGVQRPAFCGAPSLITFDDQNPHHARLHRPGHPVKGYDNMTGIGTPHGQQFINALRKMEG